jgi:hypothetical protein
MLQYTKAESTIKPSAIEIESNSVVYVRKNITEVERSNIDGTKTTYYQYDEAEITKTEYEKYISELTANNADSIAGIIAKQAEQDDNQLIIMSAIADLYDAVAPASSGS